MRKPLLVKDSAWVKQSFFVTGKDLELVDNQNSMWSAASLKFTDTTLGGNFAINPPPQFTASADIKVPSRTPKGKGMGDYYSRAIDDNSQIVHFRMGVARFNSMTTFFNSFYDSGAGQLARTGRAGGAFYNIGKAIGFVVSVMSFKLLMVRAIGMAFRFLMMKPSSRYYYHSPTMPLYWNAVQTILNQVSVNRGIVPRVGGADQEAVSNNYEFSAEDRKILSRQVPDIFDENGQINIYAVANKAQRLFRQRQKKAEVMMNLNDSERFNISKAIQDVNSQMYQDSGANYQEYLRKWVETDQAKPRVDGAGNSVGASDVENTEGFFSGFKKLWEFFEAESDDGAAFASFRVNQTGQVSESFSNSVGESELSSKLNGMVSSASSVNFSLAGGNIAPGLDQIIGAVKNTVIGVIDGVGLSGLAALGGAAFVDIPKTWQSSMADMPTANYTIKLISPYGNPISQLINIYTPLAMLLAMVLPLSTGKHSYTSPFLIEFYDAGRAQSRLGIISSMNITRGTANLAFNNTNTPMAIDVSFTVQDMSSVMHMPINMGIKLADEMIGAATGAIAGSVAGPLGAIGGAAIGASLASGVFDDDTVFSDYLAVISGMGLADQIYGWRRLKLNLTRKLANWRSWTSTAHLASFMGDTFPGRLWSILYKGTSR